MKSVKEMAGNMMAIARIMIKLVDTDILDDYMVSSELKAILSSDNFALLLQEMVNRGYISRDEMRRMFAFEPAARSGQST